MPAVEEYVSTSDDQAESGNSTAEDAQVPSTKPVSVKGYANDNKTATIHIIKFHSFTMPETDTMYFNTFFYFIGKTIPHFINFRVRITYNSRLRNLQSEQADSVRTDCVFPILIFLDEFFLLIWVKMLITIVLQIQLEM